MKSILIFIFAFLFVAVFNICAQQKTDLQKMNLRDKVKSLVDSTIDFPLKNGIMNIYDDDITGHYEFNQAGNIVRFKTDLTYDYSDYRKLNIYDKKNQLVSSNIFYSFLITREDWDNDFEREMNYAYDEKGRMIKETWEEYNPRNGGTGSVEYNLRPDGKPTLVKEYASGYHDTLINTKTYSYNQKGQLVKRISIDYKFGYEPQDSIILIYDKKARLTDSIVYSSNKDTLSWKKISYTNKITVTEEYERGKMITKTMNDPKNKTLAVEYYDYSQGKLYKHTREESKSGELRSKKVKEYTREKETITDFTYIYEYDTHKNWTKRSMYWNNEKIKERIRVITYYD